MPGINYATFNNQLLDARDASDTHRPDIIVFDRDQETYSTISRVEWDAEQEAIVIYS